MSEALLNSMIDKIDAGEKKINQLIEKVEQLKVDEQILTQIKIGVENVGSNIQKITFPEKEMRQLSLTLHSSVALLKQPVKQEIIHHHHAPKFIWITAALFIIVCLEAGGWYMTTNKLSMYKANDTKYRFLKLQGDKTLIKWVRVTDSLNLVNSRLRDTVINKEDQNQKEFEMMQQALEMEREARELKRKVRIKK